MSLPPSLLSLEGWLSVTACFIVYTVSVASLGEKSIAHNWLFTGLQVYSPTHESVEKLAVADPPSTTNNGRKRTRKTLNDRLAALELQSTEVQRGVLAMSSLESSEGLKMWTNLNNACVGAFSCVFALGLCFVMGWIRALSSPCCSDLSCWVDWWQRQQNAVPLLSLLAIMAFHSAWTLGKLSSMLGVGGLTYPLGSIISGIVCGLISLWVITSPTLLQRLGIPAQLALQEAEARILLWLRLVGVRVASEPVALDRLIKVGQFVFATLCGSLGFVLWDPLQGTVQIMVYRWQQLLQRPERQWSWYHSVLGMASLFPLSFLILLTYLMPDRGDVPALHVRTLAAWLHVWMMCSLAKDLLQCYMDQAIPQVSMILSQPDPPMSDRVMHPFRSRFQSLMRTGSQMVTFPFCIVALLTVGHLCHVHSDIYPVPYGGTTFDKWTLSNLKAWEQIQVVNMANSAVNSTGFLSQFSPTRANACGETLEAKKKPKKQPRSGKELLATAKPVRTSLAQVLGGLQVLALMAREDQIARTVLEHRENSSDTENGSADTEKVADELLSMLTAVLLHPILTSTVVFPLVDLIGFLLCVFWMVSMTVGVITNWKRMRQLGQHNVKIDCKKD